MRTILFFFIVNLLLLTIKVDGQINLVPNSSFEFFTSCPPGGSQLSLAFPWKGVTTNSTDYYNACGTGGANVPYCGNSWQYARTGVAYAGIYAINAYGGDYREYLQVKLDNTLQQDSCYLIEFYCNLYNYSTFIVDKMGALLSNTAVSDVGPSTWGTVLQHTPQIVSTQFLSDTLNWMRIGGYYKANGGEQYITIGNFSKDSDTDTLHMTNNGGIAYYYVDDVTVQKVSNCDTVTTMKEYNNGTAFSLFPNPNDGNILLKYNIKQSDKGAIKIYDVTGKLMEVYVLSSSSKQLNISTNLKSGIYFYQVIVNGDVVKSDKVVIIK